MFSNTVDSIVGALSTTVDKLYAVAQKRATEVVEIGNKMVILEAEADVGRNERDRATRIARKLEEILK